MSVGRIDLTVSRCFRSPFRSRISLVVQEIHPMLVRALSPVAYNLSSPVLLRTMQLPKFRTTHLNPRSHSRAQECCKNHNGISLRPTIKMTAQNMQERRAPHEELWIFSAVEARLDRVKIEIPKLMYTFKRS